MSTCPNGVWNHTDGCTCAPNGSVTAEVETDLVPLAADNGMAFNAVGSCPDCGQPMIGHVGNNRFVPGASCSSCPHTAMTYEWETEPNEEDRVYLYEVQEDLLIRVTDEDGDTTDLIRPDEDSHAVHWDREITGLGFDPAAFRRAHLAVSDPHSFVEEETARHRYDHLAGTYSVLLDRERVPEHVIVARASDRDSMAADDEAIESAIDALFEHGDLDDKDAYDIDDEEMARIEAACDEAGLGVMKGIYESMANREILLRNQVQDATDVTSDYERALAPSINRIEDALLRAYGTTEETTK